MNRYNAAKGLIVLFLFLLAAATVRPEAVAVLLIEDYQARISPRKGYTCAYARVYGGPGCSAYAKRVIGKHGLYGGLVRVRWRFRQCYRASRPLPTGRTICKQPGAGQNK